MSPRSKEDMELQLKVSLIACCLGNNIRITVGKIHIFYLMHLDIKTIP